MGCGLEANIEDLVKYYLKEKNDKEWNRILLCKLQKKYDLLQRRYALAENTIDSYRFITYPYTLIGQKNKIFNFF